MLWCLHQVKNCVTICHRQAHYAVFYVTAVFYAKWLGSQDYRIIFYLCGNKKFVESYNMSLITIQIFKMI